MDDTIGNNKSGNDKGRSDRCEPGQTLRELMGNRPGAFKVEHGMILLTIVTGALLLIAKLVGGVDIE